MEEREKTVLPRSYWKKRRVREAIKEMNRRRMKKYKRKGNSKFASTENSVADYQ